MNSISRWFVRASAAALCTLAATSLAHAGPGRDGPGDGHGRGTPHSGACCSFGPTGATTCAVMAKNACHSGGGFYRGDSVACDAGGVCPALAANTPTGACCLTRRDPDLCVVTSRQYCNAVHGRFAANGVACGPAGACAVRIACCYASGVCEMSFAERCAANNGTAGAPGSTCRPNNCPQPVRGACCITRDIHAVCAIVTSDRCTRSHGTYQGDNVACTATLCPQPVVGACCIAATSTVGARCTIGTSARCTTASGTYGGDNSTCRSANCPTSCPCDWDHNGFLSAADVAAFLNDFLAGNGDFNGDGTTNNDDLRAFASCFDTAPTGCVRRR